MSDTCQWCGASRQTERFGGDTSRFTCGSTERWQSMDCGYISEINVYRIALADAIRRPMGVIPASAEGLVSDEDLEAAEERRINL